MPRRPCCRPTTGARAGSLSALSCFSFHRTKNIVSGEGGALVVNLDHLVERSDVIREKGTNRVAFRNRTVDKYTWVDIGSSYLPGEITASFLWAQFEQADAITSARLRVWGRYHKAFRDLEGKERVRLPRVPQHCGHNAHLYYLLLPTRADRDSLIAKLAEDSIQSPFHYIPLHSSLAGLAHGRASGSLARTDSVSERLLRLPMFESLGDEQDYAIERALHHLGG